jgi:hypothetical protein
MTCNVFTQPRQAFESAIEDSSIGKAFVIVLISALISVLYFGLLGVGVIGLGTILVWVIVQWFVLSVLLFAFEILFSGQKRHNVRADFGGAATVAGKLWLWVILLEVLLLLFGGNLFSWIPLLGVIVLFVIGIAILVNLFIGIKVLLDSSNGRAFVAWLLILIVYSLLITLAAITANSVILL